MRHGLPSPWVAGRTAYACRRGAGTPADEKCRCEQGGGAPQCTRHRYRISTRRCSPRARRATFPCTSSSCRRPSRASS
ncbi:hypothetical protein DM992_03205 [Burkholderia sp. JP2-270]|nr:hypothetical protein DM992_03205 [Burkholderia sp. JP2-270]